MSRRFRSAIALASLIFSAYRSMFGHWLAWAFAAVPVLADPPEPARSRIMSETFKDLGRSQARQFVQRRAQRLPRKRDNSNLVGGLIAAI